ncbi:hypothetical protein AUC43_04875 [Hymenobacter sedentarius]|uniref:Uncharacterized protein n=2 Tax=Hymenobacter sedentarius TaxID=1411621 RepID=A0A0U4BL93_9BACT|nr:hypothetical protein AUC43_04875 [Hymenobacter sedentarius]
MGYMRWRLRTGSRQAFPVAAAYPVSTTAPWWRTVPVVVAFGPETKVMEVGGLMMCKGDAPQIGGHPDIRY